MTDATRESAVDVPSVAPDVRLPGRIDMRRAFDLYVFGRDRTLAPREKSEVIGGAVEARLPTPPGGGLEVDAAAKRAVSVPVQLQFDRGAGTRRERPVRGEQGAP